MKRIVSTASSSFVAVLMSGCCSLFPASCPVQPGPVIGGPAPTNPNSSVSRPATLNQDCVASFYTPQGNFKGKVAALEIPLGHWAGGPLKVGNLDLDQGKVQQLSSAAQVAEQARLLFCRATNPEVLGLLSESDRRFVIEKATDSMGKVMENVDTFVRIVITTNDPNEAAAAAEKLKEAASEAKKQFTAPTTPQPELPKTGSVDPSNPSWQAALVLMQVEFATNITSLSNKVEALNERLIATHQRSNVKIIGFADNSTNLAATERERVFKQFQDALAKIPENQRPVIFVVGYASKAGPYLKNIDLGLRRAQSVLNMLQEQKFSRLYEGHAMSGGVDDSAYSNRVDIFLTGA